MIDWNKWDKELDMDMRRGHRIHELKEVIRRLELEKQRAYDDGFDAGLKAAQGIYCREQHAWK